MNSDDAVIVNDLIAVCYEGQIFYRDAIECTRVPAMQPAFHQMAAIKAEIINDLMPCMPAASSQQRNVMLVYGIQQSYKAIKTKLESGDEREAAARIQVLEQCILNLMQDALEKVKASFIRDLLEVWYATAATAYNAIRNRQSLIAA
ncbi:MAG TPA: hypothetical protein VGL10_09575 [Gammaproteobacteria bacterium]